MSTLSLYLSLCLTLESLSVMQGAAARALKRCPLPGNQLAVLPELPHFVALHLQSNEGTN